MPFVLDSSVALAWVLPDESGTAADSLMERLLNDARGHEKPAGSLHNDGQLGRSAMPDKDW